MKRNVSHVRYVRVLTARGLSRLPFVIVGTALALVTVMSPAARAGGEPARLGDGRVVADGAAIDLPVTLECPEGWQGGMNLGAVQSLGGGRFATGSGYAPVSCTGEKQRFVVHVQVNPKRKTLFRSGLISIRGALQTYEQPDSSVPAGLPVTGALHHPQGSRSWDTSGEVRVR